MRSGCGSRPGSKREVAIHAKRNGPSQFRSLMRSFQAESVELELLIFQLKIPFPARPTRSTDGRAAGFRAQLHVPASKFNLSQFQVAASRQLFQQIFFSYTSSREVNLARGQATPTFAPTRRPRQLCHVHIFNQRIHLILRQRRELRLHPATNCSARPLRFRIVHFEVQRVNAKCA